MPFTKKVINDVWMSAFQGCISFLDVVEPYMPDRVLRQFGYTQSIPHNPIPPLTVCRSSNIRKYKVKYPRKESNWFAPDGHILSVRQLGARARPPSACTPDYMDWYLPLSHPRVVNTGLLPRNIPITQPQLPTDSAVIYCHVILIF